MTVPWSVRPPAAGKRRGPVRSRSSLLRACWPSSIISKAPSCCPRPSHGWRLRRPPGSTSRTSRAKRAPSGPSKSPPPAASIDFPDPGGPIINKLWPPGSGKSMLAARLPGLLPPLEPAEALELGMIQSVAGGLRGNGLTRERPFRDPHHSASLPALIGGGMRARPGEISLAHQGVLFLDELPEFNRNALEALRQPLETGRVSVARANGHVTYPARFQLVAAMNPCRCGQLADQACGRAPRCAEEYQSRLSGPLIDRIDLHIDVPAVSAADLSLPPPSEGTAAVARRVAAARQRQAQRYAKLPENRRIRTNAEADGGLLDEVAAPDREGRALLVRAAERLRLSARGYHRVMRVARTLADLEGASIVGRRHIAEALSYRRQRKISEPTAGT